MQVQFTSEGRLGLIRLSRPPDNALDDPAALEIEALERFLAEPLLAGIVVAGEGRHFSSGADRVSLARQLSEGAALARRLELGKRWIEALALSPVPTVAAIRGQCLGAGLEIALACHFRVASSGAMLGFPESTLGLMPGLGGTMPLLYTLPPPHLIELILSGRLLGSDEALALGLIDAVDADPLARARRLLDGLVGGKPAHLIRAVMESVHNGRRLERESALHRETELFCDVARSLANSSEEPREER